MGLWGWSRNKKDEKGKDKGIKDEGREKKPGFTKGLLGSALGWGLGAVGGALGGLGGAAYGAYKGATGSGDTKDGKKKGWYDQMKASGESGAKGGFNSLANSERAEWAMKKGAGVVGGIAGGAVGALAGPAGALAGGATGAAIAAGGIGAYYGDEEKDYEQAAAIAAASSYVGAGLSAAVTGAGAVSYTHLTLPTIYSV